MKKSKKFWRVENHLNIDSYGMTKQIKESVLETFKVSKTEPFNFNLKSMKKKRYIYAQFYLE
jgi:hypothetical protein